MIIYRCRSCGREGFEKRAICPSCRGEEFYETDSQTVIALVVSELTVTPSGFEDRYKLALGTADGAKVLYRQTENNKA